MARFAWCIEGRHEGTKPEFSRPCPGRVGNSICSCECHKAKFARRKK